MKLLCLLLLVAPLSSFAASETKRLNQWLDAEFLEYLEFYPQSKKRYGINADYDKLNDASLAHRAKVLVWRKESVGEMKQQFKRDALDEQGQISYDLWDYMLERSEASVPYQYHSYIFGRRGPHTSLPRSLIGSHKVTSLADMQAYIAKLRQMDRALGQSLDRAKTSAKKDIRAPFFDYEIASRQSKRVIDGAPFTESGKETPLWADINKKIDALLLKEAITQKQAELLRTDAKAALLEHVLPAYQTLIAWLDTDVEKAGKEAKGAWSLPDGENYYQYALNRNTTLELTADEIHEIGLAEVKRIHGEMRAIKDTVKFEGDLKGFFKHMRESDEFYFPSTDEGRAEYLALARTYLAAMEIKLPEYFGVLPKGKLDVKRVEAYREQPGGSAHYVRGTPDGSRPGVFYAHLVDMRAAAVYRLENLAYHEGVPGHHMQIAIQQELTGLPRFRSHHGYTAFSEGWGLYSEYLGKEMGFYTSPYNDFGRLSGELWRSIRLVVDTGMHSKGWTQQQVNDYALNNSPYPEVKAKAEVRRYFNNPAQAVAYKIGMLKIMELRQQAERELGDKFDIRSFHDTVIGAGPLPMKVLERRINQWIGSQT
jgi:uncharacterized protein (DUF885 family)